MNMTEKLEESIEHIKSFDNQELIALRDPFRYIVSLLSLALFVYYSSLYSVSAGQVCSFRVPSGITFS